MTIKCKNRSLFTWDDFISGKLICMKCVLIITLFFVVCYLCINAMFYDESKQAYDQVYFWLIAITSIILYLKLANNRPSDPDDQFLKIDKKGVAVFENGKRKNFESYANIQLTNASWTPNYNGLYPAFQLKSKKLGTIRIGLTKEEFHWLHIKTIFTDVHYTIEDKTSWKQYEEILRQYL